MKKLLIQDDTKKVKKVDKAAPFIPKIGIIRIFMTTFNVPLNIAFNKLSLINLIDAKIFPAGILKVPAIKKPSAKILNGVTESEYWSPNNNGTIIGANMKSTIDIDKLRGIKYFNKIL